MPSEYCYLLSPDKSKEDQTEKFTIAIYEVTEPIERNFLVNECYMKSTCKPIFSSFITVKLEAKQSTHYYTYLLFYEKSREQQIELLIQINSHLVSKPTVVEHASKPSNEEVLNALIHMIELAKKDIGIGPRVCKLYARKGNPTTTPYNYRGFKKTNLLEPKGWCHWLTDCCASLFCPRGVTSDGATAPLLASLK